MKREWIRGLAWYRIARRERTDPRRRTFFTSILKGSLIRGAKTENVFDFYEKKCPIQSGRFGQVHEAQCRKTGNAVAIKTIMKARNPKDVLRSEINILKKLDHPGLMNLRDVFEDDTNIYIISDLYQGDEVFDRIIDRETLSESQAASLVREVLEALNHLHTNLGIAHRDMKPENLMYASDSNDSNVVIVDFGMASEIAPGKRIRDRVGTPGYVAPEVLDSVHDFKCDMWSLGVILYILMCGSPPFYGNNELETLSMVRKGTYSLEGSTWAYVSEPAKDLIGKLMEKDPEKRLSAAEALEHEWIRRQQDEAALGPSVLNSMSQFVQMERLKREALNYIAKMADASEVQHLVDVFRAHDEENTGRLSFETANKALRGGAEELGVDLFEELDTDHDGSISLREFVAAAMKRDMFLAEEKLLSAFQHFDVDGDGCLTAADLEHHLGDRIEDIKAMVDRLDINGDGKIDMDEFIAMMRNE